MRSIHVQQHPKVGFFSGALEVGKGEVSYPQWRHEVVCLINENHPINTIMQAIRRSLKGTAAEVLLNLGVQVQPDEVVERFDIIFGNVLTNEAILEEFYTCRQKERETAVEWGCRVESLLKQAKDQRAVRGDTEDMARTKFWSGLKDERVRIALRHRFDSGSPFVIELLRQTRMLEHEYSKKHSIKVHVQTAADPIQEKLDQVLQRLAELETKMVKIDQQPQVTHPRAQPKYCTFCKRLGHVINECRTRRRQQGNGNQPIPGAGY